MKMLKFFGALTLLILVISCGKDDESNAKMVLKIDGEVISLEDMNLFLYSEQDRDMVGDLSESNTHTEYYIIATDAANTEESYTYKLEFKVYTPIGGDKSGEYRLLEWDEYSGGEIDLTANEKVVFTEFYVNRGDEDDWYGWDVMNVDGDLTINVSGAEEDIIKIVSSGSFERWRTILGDFGSDADELNLDYSLEFTATLVDAPILDR